MVTDYRSEVRFFEIESPDRQPAYGVSALRLADAPSRSVSTKLAGLKVAAMDRRGTRDIRRTATQYELRRCKR